MSSPSDDLEEYVFKMPFATSIHPQLIPNETLSILHDINASLTPSLRLPIEILVQIQDEVHRPNTVWQNIRSTWTAESHVDEPDDPILTNHGYLEDATIPLSKASLDTNLVKYSILENKPAIHVHHSDKAICNMYHHMSSADLLYRLRCFFPEIYLDPSDGYKGVWEACVHHNQTGFSLGFLDHRAGATVMYNCRPTKPTAEYRKKLEAFSQDSVRLLNALIGTADSTDGETQFPYFHPTAWASRISSDLRYIAVPTEIAREPIEHDGTDRPLYSFQGVSDALWPPSSSPFRSLLPDLKYDVKSRKIDPINGTTPLTEIISSALLFYRLLCQTRLDIKPNRNITVAKTGWGVPMTTCVWQVEFFHSKDWDSRILFMDDRGLFDIRANEVAVKVVMNEIVDLINLLCSDNCRHPYNRVAGCAISN